jgi:hypothetical protein
MVVKFPVSYFNVPWLHGCPIQTFSYHSFVFSYHSFFINKSPVYFQISRYQLSLMPNQVRSTSSQRLLVPCELSTMGAHHQCPPGQILCPLRTLPGVRGQGLQGLMDARAVSSLVSAGLLWLGGRKCSCPLSERQLGIGHILGILSSLEGREWKGRCTLELENQRSGEDMTHLSTCLSLSTYVSFVSRDSPDKRGRWATPPHLSEQWFTWT